MNVQVPKCPHGPAHDKGPATYGHVEPCPTRLKAVYGVADLNALPWVHNDSEEFRRRWNVAYGKDETDETPWVRIESPGPFGSVGETAKPYGTT